MWLLHLATAPYFWWHQEQSRNLWAISSRIPCTGVVSERCSWQSSNPSARALKKNAQGPCTTIPMAEIKGRVQGWSTGIEHVRLYLSPITPNKTNEQKSNNNNNSKPKQKTRQSYSLQLDPLATGPVLGQSVSLIFFCRLPHAAQIAEHTCWVLSFHPSWASDSSHTRKEDVRMCTAPCSVTHSS